MPKITWHHSSCFIIPELPSGSNLKGFEQEISKYRVLPGSFVQDRRQKGRKTEIHYWEAFCLVYYSSHSSFTYTFAYEKQWGRGGCNKSLCREVFQSNSYICPHDIILKQHLDQVSTWSFTFKSRHATAKSTVK